MSDVPSRQERFNELVGKHQPRIRAFARRRLNMVPALGVEPDDVVNDVIRRVLPKVTDRLLEKEIEFFRYTCRAVRSSVQDLGKAYRRHNLRRDGDARPSEQPTPSSTTPSRVSSKKERVDALRAAIDDLPAEDAALIRSLRFDEEPVSVIAQRRGVSIDVVRRRSTKILERLERELGAIMRDEFRDAIRDRRSEDPDP
ncbi:MAG: sigma-70 family RNA polymerase sigma factor [Planctomycetota bacterium]